MNVAIIGCGLIGNKRASRIGHCKLIACADIILEKATQLAASYPGCKAYPDWHDVIADSDIDIIIIATQHNSLTEIALAAIQAGKHVLIEKPAGKHSSELEQIMHLTGRNKSLIRVGFNHRYHRAFRQARELVDQHAIGELMYIRARYGHGGRLGYNTEWRANPDLSGGGELIDQGVHLIDLARSFLGDFTEVQGYAHTYYWDMPVEDNGFLILKTAKQQVAFLHASCTEWKNLFSFEIYGQYGKLEINGLGGSYGIERLSFYKMTPSMGPPETTIWEYPMPDDSWEVEFQEFIEDIQNQRTPSANIKDAYAALKIVEEIYRISNYAYHS